ncbi:MAG: hypothetical protein U0894_01640 [Pirellulales bacterium]
MADENAGISNPRILGVNVLDRLLGRYDVYVESKATSSTTRGLPFFPTEGHRIGLQFEQVMGDFQYSR